MRKTAAVAELKANLSRYLGQVKAGEEILVTERGVAIARLVPVAAIDQSVEQLRDLERQGLVRLGTGKLPKGFWTLPRPRDPGAAVRAGVGGAPLVARPHDGAGVRVVRRPLARGGGSGGIRRPAGVNPVATDEAHQERLRALGYAE